MIHVKVINGRFVTCWPQPPPRDGQQTWPQVVSERYLRLGVKTRKKVSERVTQTIRMDAEPGDAFPDGRARGRREHECTAA
jgi:hypothetical protein